MAGLPVMVKAALPVVPGVNLVPGVRKTGGDLPDDSRVRHEVETDPSHVASYADLCGFPHKDTLPLPYPHLLAFGLHMEIMTAGSFPFPAIGTVHLENSITQHRPIGLDEPLTVTARPADLRPHPKGQVFDMQSYSVQEAPQTEASLAYLAGSLALPAGWSFQTRTLDAPLTVTAVGGMATIIQDDLSNTYQLSQQ